MVQRTHFLLQAGTYAALGLLTACGSKGGAGGPRVGEVPQQLTAGGGVFALDLADYVSDRDSTSFTYSVTDGGGSFANSTYSNTFDTMGDYTVAFTVSDGQQTTPASFHVKVTSANFLVVDEGGSGLLLVDADTGGIVRVAGAAPAPGFGAGLADGRLVYQLGSGSSQQLWVFDPMTRRPVQIGASATGPVTYRARTSDGKIVYTTGPTSDTDLWLYDVRSGLTREISAQSGQVDGNPYVNSSDLVFYERGHDGQADIWYYDPATDTTAAIGTAATAEHILAVLANGALLYSELGSGGEHKLRYWKRGDGLVEVGASDSRDKTFRVGGNHGEVVYTAASDLVLWKPSDASVTTIDTANAFPSTTVAAGNQLVYTKQAGGAGDVDAYYYDLDDGVNATLRNAADVTSVLAVTSDGSTQYAILQGSGATSSVLAVSLVSAPSTVTHAGGGAMEFQRTLDNGDVLARRTDGTALARFRAAAGTWSTLVTGTGLRVVGAGVDAGDFVYERTASAQVDLAMWDASVPAAVAVSTTTGDDTWQATMHGKVFFTRDDTAGHANLFAFDVAGQTTTQLTTTDDSGLGADHTVLGTYTGSR